MPLSNLSPNTDPGRITVAGSEVFQTSSRQLDLDDVLRALAVVSPRELLWYFNHQRYYESSDNLSQSL
jgi:hypothetical protein